jgi:hypothetical protein
MLRLGRIYPGKTTWGPAHMKWLMAEKLEHREQRITFEELLDGIRQESERVVHSITTGLMHRSKWRSYSITRSAIVSRAGGISIARALAVLRLITSWNFVGRDGWTVDGIFPRLAELRHHRGAQSRHALGRPRADDRSAADPDG